MGQKKLLPIFEIDHEFLENYESEETRKTYVQALNSFFKFMGNFYPNILKLAAIERKMIIHHRNHIKGFSGPNGQLMAPNAVSLRFAAISSYFIYLL